MGSRSVIGYERDAEFRGVYVHGGGEPSEMLPLLWERFQHEGYEELVAWVERGIVGAGYSNADDEEPYNDDDSAIPWKLRDESWGYLITEEGPKLEYTA